MKIGNRIPLAKHGTETCRCQNGNEHKEVTCMLNSSHVTIVIQVSVQK